MAWEPFFIAPAEQTLFEWHYSGSISPAGTVGRSTSSNFLFRIASFVLDDPVKNYGNGVTVSRDWFNVYYAVAEFGHYTSPASTPTMGETVFYNPKSQEDHGFEVMTELCLPYKPKPGQEDKGRFIGVKKLPRKSGQRLFGRIQGYGNPWQFGEVSGTISRRTNDDDKLLLQIYHWTEEDASPTLIYTGIEQQVYEKLTLTPQRIGAIISQFDPILESAVVDALLELKRKGLADNVVGRKGEYWSVAIPY